MWKVCVAICVHSLITYGFHCADFGENHSQSVNICGYLLYQIICAPDKEM